MLSKLRVTTLAMLAVVMLLSACQGGKENGNEVTTEGGSYRAISAAELKTMLENKDFFMVNVHTPWEGDIPQTDLQLSYDQIENNLDQLPKEKDSKILVYCLTSGMAKKATATLLDQGYTNLWMLDGGTIAWQEAGFSVEGTP